MEGKIDENVIRLWIGKVSDLGGFLGAGSYVLNDSMQVIYGA